MLRAHLLVGAALCVASMTMAQTAPPKTHLKVGDTAPDFTLPSTAKKQIKLSDFRGKSVVVLAFFPAAFTGGCTKEMTAYGANLEKFEKMGAQVFGISTDNTPSLDVFAQQTGATFPLLSDFAKRSVSKEYGVLMADRGIANRATFVVDLDGKITHIEEGSAAVNISGAEMACSRLKK